VKLVEILLASLLSLLCDDAHTLKDLLVKATSC